MLALVILAVALGASSASAEQRPQRAQADLVLQSVEPLPSRKPQYFLIDGPRRDDFADFRIRVKNAGEAATRADGKLRIINVINDEVQLPIVVKDFQVPRLRPGRSHTTVVAVHLVLDGLRLGFFGDRACVASRKDRRGRNNCRSGKSFSVIPDTWDIGAEMSDVFDGSVTETASTTAAFSFERAFPGAFRYAPRPGVGSVSYSTTGTDSNGCGWTGAREYFPAPESRFNLSADNSRYGIAANVVGNYPISISCPPQPPSGFTGPINPIWIDTLQRRFKERFVTRLEGTRTVGPTTYTWQINSSWMP